MSRGPADHLVVGDWNARCDRCGRKMKGSQLVKTWQGFWVCAEHWEPRQPQDFVRSIIERPTPPFVRNPVPIFVGPSLLFCSPMSRLSRADIGEADCATVGWI